MNTVLLVAQMILSVILIIAILVQSKGTGFGRAWSAGPKSFTRRGLEKLVFKATFILVGLLMLVSVLALFS